MPRVKYSQEVVDFVRENAKGKRLNEIVEITNKYMGTDFNESKMKAFLSKKGIKTGTKRGIPAGQPTDLFPQEIMDYIKENHKGIGPSEMAGILNDKFNKNYKKDQIKRYYGSKKLNSGVSGRFEKGIQPWNKGRKGVTTGGKDTQFKKGHRPSNWVPIGSERFTADGYWEVKVQDGKKQHNWRRKNMVIYEKHHGKIPPGHVVLFGDGDVTNFDIDNLILVSRRQLSTLNKMGLIKSDADLTRAGINIAKLIQKINDVK